MSGDASEGLEMDSEMARREESARRGGECVSVLAASAGKCLCSCVSELVSAHVIVRALCSLYVLCDSACAAAAYSSLESGGSAAQFCSALARFDCKHLQTIQHSY
jgi:hypothetical protein